VPPLALVVEFGINLISYIYIAEKQGKKQTPLEIHPRTPRTRMNSSYNSSGSTVPTQVPVARFGINFISFKL